MNDVVSLRIELNNAFNLKVSVLFSVDFSDEAFVPRMKLGKFDSLSQLANNHFSDISWVEIRH
jgi:hypothetical protein